MVAHSHLQASAVIAVAQVLYAVERVAGKAQHSISCKESESLKYGNPTEVVKQIERLPLPDVER